MSILYVLGSLNNGTYANEYMWLLTDNTNLTVCQKHKQGFMKNELWP